MIDILIYNVLNENDYKIIKKSLCNTEINSNRNQLQCMIKNKAIIAISQFLKMHSTKYKSVLVALEGLENLLSIKNKENIQ